MGIEESASLDEPWAHSLPGYLTVFALEMAWFATGAFNAYQRAT